MHSQLIPGLPIQTYGLCVAAGALLAAYAMDKISRRRDGGNLVMMLLFAGLAGARIAHVIEYWHEDGFDRDFLSVFALWRGGLVFYGGLAGAAIALAIHCAVKKESLLSAADRIAVVLPLAHAFGRIGCFFHGCCWGKVSQSRLAVTFPAGSPVWFAHRAGPDAARSLPVLPVQLFEAAALLVLFAVLLLAYRRFKAHTAAGWLAGYGILRFFLEYLRADVRPSLWGFSSAQLVSIVLVAAGIALFAATFRKKCPAST